MHRFEKKTKTGCSLGQCPIQKQQEAKSILKFHAPMGHLGSQGQGRTLVNVDAV